MRAKDILLCLTQARPTISKLKNQGKPYDPLIDVLVAIGDDDRVPSSKELQQKFSISPTNVKKWIDSLYDDFIQGGLTPYFLDTDSTNWYKFTFIE